MTIVSQNRKSIFNYENVFGVAVIGEYVHVFYNKNESCAIGHYASEERACEVLRELTRCTCANYISTGSDNDIYTMPKE